MAKQKSKLGFWTENRINIIGWIVVAGLIAGFVGLTVFTNQQTRQRQDEVLGVQANDHIKGNPDAENVLIEYSDFACSACLSYTPTLMEILEEMGEEVKLIYRHLPQESIPGHEFAEEAAIATEAAAEQDKFWEMHDALFDIENYQKWVIVPEEEQDAAAYVRQQFVSFATEIGLDVEQFKKDLDSPELADRVNNSIKEARSIGLSATPSLFLNGRQLNNNEYPLNADDLRQLIDG